ncbi:MAG: DUF6152 family protein [Aquincola tertiaricarbonis]|uniref:DUF6152 family protein n=1 Tax=Aquincola sp. J276 TaxID=2898432 RepID=UPI002151188A|nr:DUF6152 family protein [Aquincola sp. J276]MCR5866888.1 DUF6152 family protein [Aquincola sp. J276]
MQRRQVLAIAVPGALMLARSAWAHHGWSSFDQQRPLYLEGKAVQVAWRNPHAELTLERPPNLQLPADLAQRPVPAQASPVDGPALLQAARLPTRNDRRWTIELAPLTRLQAWGMPPIAEGTDVAVLGFTFTGEKGDPVLRAEYVWVGGKAYGLRSSPA